MSFRDFVTSRRYRRQMGEHREPYAPARPSRRWLAKRVAQLLSPDEAHFAQRELSLAGPAVVGPLTAALGDRRYLAAESDGHVCVSAPLDAVLELLVPHAPDAVAAVAVPRLTSASEKVRKTAAIHLASLGRAADVPALVGLLNDESGYVRSYVCIGLRRAVVAGRGDGAFRRAAYDAVLSQCDQDWPGTLNDAADVVIALDPARAAVDLSSPRLLSVENRALHRLLQACNAAGVALVADRVAAVFDAAADRAIAKSYPHSYTAGEAIKMLARTDAAAARSRLPVADAHPDKDIRAAAAAARAALSGVTEAVNFVLGQVKRVGYTGLTPPQRVVYNAFCFDAELCNGGLMQFFANGTGGRAVDTLDGLRTLDCRPAVAALDGALRAVGPLARATSREDRLTAFEDRYDELAAAFKPLEEAYWPASADLRRRWLAHAAGHADHFRDGSSMSV